MTAESPAVGSEILIVDDTPANLEALSLLLAGNGYRVRAANSGEAALKSFAAKAPDLVLLDVRMPGMNGYEVCRRIKQMSEGDVPIIFISAWDETEEKVQAFKAGGVDYVVKPFQEQEVLARVRTHIELRLSRKELEAWGDELANRVMERTAELEDANIALAESEQRFRAIFDQTFQFMGLLSVDGTLLAVNKTALLFIGSTEAEVVGKPFWETAWWTHSQEQQDLVKLAIRTAAAGRSFRNETTHVSVEGTLEIVDFSIKPMRDEHGEIIYLIPEGRPITEERKAQEELRKTEEVHQKQLMQADKLASVGLMAAGIAHEINNPTNLIMMNAGVMQSFWEQFSILLRKLDEQIAGLPMDEAVDDFDELLSGIGGGAERIKKIVQNMKEFARFDAGQLDDSITATDVVESAVSLSANFINKATSHFELQLTADLPPVKGNLQKLEQVLINLIGNACQALTSKDQSIRISTAFNDEDSLVVIEVADTGMGIAEEDLRQILDPFFTTKRDSGGTGLGLSVSYGIIQEHGGKLEFDSEEGRGTTARIMLPALPTLG